MTRLASFIEAQGLTEDIFGDPASMGGDQATPKTEPLSCERVLAVLDADGAVADIRLHHELYLNDPRRTKPDRLRTVIRHPVTAHHDDAATFGLAG